MTVSESVYEAIPLQLKELKNWVLWKYVTRNGKKTKIPYQINGTEANVRDPSTWNTFENACKAKLNDMIYSGIGFVFSANTGMVGVDFDHVRDSINGEWNQAELQDILSLGSYAEISPSGSGAHVICIGVKPEGRCRSGPHEMYGNGRFFTITGNRIPESNPDISCMQPAINRLYSKWFSSEQKADVPRTRIRKLDPMRVSNNVHISYTTPADDEIISICNHAKNSAKFKRLFDGDCSGYHSPSEADFALCRIFAFYTSDVHQIHRLLNRSKLRREKWERPGYLTKTISNAVNMTVVKYGN